MEVQLSNINLRTSKRLIAVNKEAITSKYLTDYLRGMNSGRSTESIENKSDHINSHKTDSPKKRRRLKQFHFTLSGDFNKRPKTKLPFIRSHSIGKPNDEYNSLENSLDKEAGALHSLKMLSMEQDPENPLEKELEEFYNPRLFKHDLVKQSDFSNTTNSFIPPRSRHMSQSNSPIKAFEEASTNHPNGTNKKLLIPIPQEKKAGIEKRGYHTQRHNNEKAHLYKLCESQVKERDPFEFDRMNNSVLIRKNGSPQDTRKKQTQSPQMNPSKFRNKSTPIIPYSEQIQPLVTLKLILADLLLFKKIPVKDLINSVESLRIEPTQQTLKYIRYQKEISSFRNSPKSREQPKLMSKWLFLAWS